MVGQARHGEVGKSRRGSAWQARHGWWGADRYGLVWQARGINTQGVSCEDRIGFMEAKCTNQGHRP